MGIMQKKTVTTKKAIVINRGKLNTIVNLMVTGMVMVTDLLLRSIVAETFTSINTAEATEAIKPIHMVTDLETDMDTGMNIENIIIM
jgi:hypothetical protein